MTDSPRPSLGPPALRRFAPRGWESPSRPPDRSSADVVDGSSWMLARLWSTASTLRAGMSRVLLGVDGEAMVQTSRRSLRLAPGQLLVAPGREPLQIRNDDPWARFEWHLRAPALHYGTPQDLVRHVTLTPHYYRLLTGTANLASTSPALGSGPGSSHLGDFFANALAAAMTDVQGTPRGLSSPQVSLLRRANAIIEERHRDAAFTVTALTEALSASKTYVYRLFDAVATTPRQAIEARRVATAVSLLKVAGTTEPDVVQQIARDAGFTSVRQMRTAIHRHSGPRPAALPAGRTAARREW